MNENADNLMDRQLYAKTLKRLINIGQSLYEYLNLEEKENLKNLKIKLSNYDVYQQKIKCTYCQETQCICYESNRSYQDLSPKHEPGNGERTTIGSKSMEQVRRTVGNNSDDTKSEDLELPF